MRYAHLFVLVLFLAGCSSLDPAAPAPVQGPVHFDASALFSMNDTYLVKEVNVRNTDYQVRLTPYEMWEQDAQGNFIYGPEDYDVMEVMVVVLNKHKQDKLRGKTMEELFAQKFENLTINAALAHPQCTFYDEPDPTYPNIHADCLDKDNETKVYISVGGEIDNEKMMQKVIDVMTA